jgi:hypothetical protein
MDISSERSAKDHECSCIPPDSLAARNLYHDHAHLLSWNPDWSHHEIADEETRRLCWSSLTLISDYIAQCETFGEEYPHFYVTEPANVSSKLFPCLFSSDYGLVLPPLSRRNTGSAFTWLLVSKGVCLGLILSQHAALEFLPSLSDCEH